MGNLNIIQISTWSVKKLPVLSWDRVSYTAYCYLGTIMHDGDVALFIVIAVIRPQPKKGKRSYDLQANPIRGKIKRKSHFTDESYEFKKSGRVCLCCIF